MIQRLWSVAVVASLVTLSVQADPNGRGKGKGGAYVPRPHGGITVKPTKPLNPRPIGIKPIGVKPTFPVGIKPIGIKPIGIKPIGIKPIGIKPLPVGIKPIGIKPIGIKPPFPIGIVKPPVKPPVVIGIVKPPVKPPVIGIVIPPKHPHPKPHWPKHPHFPHYPHYPKYPNWTYFPHCPGYGYGVAPIVISEPYPVYVQPQAGQLVLNLQCALPEGAAAQDISAVNVNLMRLADGNVEVFGVMNDAAKQSMNVTAMSTGTVNMQQVNLRMAQGDELFLESFQAENNQTYYRGSVRLLGRSDRQGLVCQLTVLNEQVQQLEESQE